jgi:hypothetical protein
MPRIHLESGASVPTGLVWIKVIQRPIASWLRQYAVVEVLRDAKNSDFLRSDFPANHSLSTLVTIMYVRPNDHSRPFQGERNPTTRCPMTCREAFATRSTQMSALLQIIKMTRD